MEIKIEKRRLTDEEIDLLVKEIRKFPNPLIGKKSWQSLEKVYIASHENDLVGVCAINELNKWIKLGPFVVFEKYHHQGLGKKILESICQEYSNANLFVGSRNPAVAKIAMRLGFHEVATIRLLPGTIRFYLIKNIFENLNIDYIKEFIRKKPTQEGPYRFFVRVKF
jgi:N-acetylglutamate synthase-like GNAT family acetyltransferase